MMDLFANFQWGVFTSLILFYFAVIAPMNDKFEQIKGHFARGDAALRKTLLIRTMVPIVALGVALLGFVIATQFVNLIGAWIAAITGIIVSACVLSLFYVGPLYPLFDEFVDAETRADRFVDSNSSQQGN